MYYQLSPVSCVIMCLKERSISYTSIGILNACKLQQGLPKYFCSKNLPKRDDIVILIDEDGDECEVIYLAEKRGLSGGWRGFAIDHGLVDGDALVFQRIRPKTLKVWLQVS